jgi:hypothetical protein
MITVYRYGFEEPQPVEEPQTPVLSYLLLAAAAWWAWRKGWLKKPTGSDSA